MRYINRRTFLRGLGLSFAGTILLNVAGCDDYIEHVLNERDKRDGKFLHSLKKYVIESKTEYSYEKGTIKNEIKGRGIIFNNGINDYFFTLRHIVDLSEGIVSFTPFGVIRNKPKDLEFHTSIFNTKLNKIDFNKTNDVAVFEIPSHANFDGYRFPLDIRTSIYPGERVAVLGDPALTGYHPRIGNVTDLDGIVFEIPVIDNEAYKNAIGTDIFVIGGDSGTPVISMEDRKLIGIMGLKFQGMSYFQPIKEFLNSISK